MNDCLHNLPIIWMTLMVFGITYLIAFAVFVVVMRLAAVERARAFKAVSPGMLPPMGTLFGLFVAFVAVQVWNDNDRATAAVDREASALRAVLILSATFPEEPQTRPRELIRSHIEEAATRGIAIDGPSNCHVNYRSPLSSGCTATYARPDAHQRRPARRAA